MWPIRPIVKLEGLHLFSLSPCICYSRFNTTTTSVHTNTPENKYHMTIRVHLSCACRCSRLCNWWLSYRKYYERGTAMVKNVRAGIYFLGATTRCNCHWQEVLATLCVRRVVTDKNQSGGERGRLRHLLHNVSVSVCSDGNRTPGCFKLQRDPLSFRTSLSLRTRV